MKKLFAVLSLLVVSAFAQDIAKPTPHPYIETMFDASGSGYGSGWLERIGVEIEEKHFVSDISVNYDTAGKTGDTTPISKGHSRGAEGAAFYKLTNGWYFGAGAGFGETLTTDYDKYSWHPSMGGGKDFSILRLQAMYLREMNEFTRYPTLVMFTSPGGIGSYQSFTCKCASGVQGIDINAWLPNPSTNRHIFFHMDLEPIWFHETLTDPYNTQAWSEAQRHQKSIDSFLRAGVLFRW